MRLPGIPDEVELVTSPSELRAGMIVWLVGCDYCEGDRTKHRIILLSLDNITSVTADGEESSGLTWNYAPECPRGANCFAVEDVHEGAVFRVVDPRLDLARYSADLDTIERVRKVVAR